MVSTFALFADFAIVRDGKPASVIVLSEKATKSAQMGAFELQHHVKMMTGAELPIVAGNNPAASGRNIIRIGGENADLKGESNRIRFQGNELLLTGNDTLDFGKVDYQDCRTFPPSEYHCKGSLFAVYDFLEIHCGFRFYFFDDAGTVFTPRKTLTVQEKNREFSPSFDAHRNIWISTRDEFDKIFKFTPRQIELGRMRWRLSNLFGYANHNEYSIYFKHWGKAKNPALAKAFTVKRPELFAQGYKGKSTGADPLLNVNFPNDRDLPAQLCYSNPDTVKYYADEVITYLRGGNVPGGWGNFSGSVKPDAILLPRFAGLPWFYPIEGGDNDSYCQCPACQQRMRGIGKNYYEKFNSDMKFKFMSDVAREAAKIDRNAGVATLAYITNLGYPENTELADNLAVGICLTNYTWWHPVAYKKQLAAYKRWVEKEAKKRPLVLWTYIFSTYWDASIHFGKYKPFPGLYPWEIGKQFKMFGRDGIRGWFTCIQLQYNHLEGYVAAKLCYDASLEPDQIIDEYFAAYYGKAGPAMKEFYREIENAYWNPANCPKSWLADTDKVMGPYGRKHPYWVTGLHSRDVNWALGTKERMAKLNHLIEEAKKQVETPNEKLRLDRIVKILWEPALAGEQEYRRFAAMKNSISPRRLCVTLAAECGGNPEKIDWSKIPKSEKWSDINGKDIGSLCSVQAAIDPEYLYLRLSDESAQDKDIADLWHDDYEIFFASGGKFPILQLAVGRNNSIVQLLYTNEHDADVRQKVDIAKNVKVKTDTNRFDVVLALPLEQLPRMPDGSFNCNFMRTKAIGSEVWNPTYTAKHLNGADSFGYIHVFPKTIQEDRFKYDNPKDCGIIEDPAASNGKTAWLLGNRGWSLAYTLPKSFPAGKYNVTVFLRSDAPVGKGLRHNLGVHDFQAKKTLRAVPVPVDAIGGKEFKKVDLGVFELKPDLYFFVGGLNEKLSGENKIYMDKIVFEQANK